MGGNAATASIVQKAKEKGIFCIVVDKNPYAKAKKYADKTYDVDGTDYLSIVSIAKKEKVDGILLGALESLMETYLQVCEIMGMHCYLTRDLYNIYSNKMLFKSTCKKFGVPVIEGGLYNNSSIGTLKNANYPLIVKPVDSSGSKGISICPSFEELNNCVTKALSFSKSNDVIVEQYLTGQEIVAYYAIQEGVASFLGMCDRYTNHERSETAPLPTAYIFPSAHTGKYILHEDMQVKQLLEGTGIKNGVMFLQGFVDEKTGQIRYYESGYRLNGAQEHHIMSATCGIDAKEMMINHSLFGIMTDETISKKADPFLNGHVGCKLSVLAKSGLIFKIKGMEHILKMKDVVYVNPSYDEGDEIKDTGTLDQIVCRFFIVSDTFSNLKNDINEIYTFFDIISENGQSLLMKQFDTKAIDNYMKVEK